MAKNVIVFCAHPDDQIFGPGGTIAKYAKSGMDIITVIFSYGESSHPWLKEEVTVDMRVDETLKAQKVFGGKNTIFFGLKEGNFLNDSKTFKINSKIVNLIKKYKPIKIFTHTELDPHPDHKNVAKLVIKAFDSMRYFCDVYTFGVWNPINTKDNENPKLVVDISDTFKTKLKALRCFKSQSMAMISLLWSVYSKAFFHGLIHHHKFAEVFYKIR